VSDDAGSPWAMDREVLGSLRLGVAEEALARDDWHRALVEAEELLAETAGHVGALSVVARAAWSLGDYGMARAAAEAWARAVPSDADARRWLAEARYGALDFEGTVALLDGGAGDAVLQELGARAYEHLGQAGSAAAALERARAAGGQDVGPMGDPTPAGWARALRRARHMLGPEARALLQAVPIEWAHLPRREDLEAERPPLAPDTIALAVGTPPAPEGEHPLDHPPELVRLYKRNLLWAAEDDESLAELIAEGLEDVAARWASTPGAGEDDELVFDGDDDGGSEDDEGLS
jgi:hypothetical protein